MGRGYEAETVTRRSSRSAAGSFCITPNVLDFDPGEGIVVLHCEEERLRGQAQGLQSAFAPGVCENAWRTEGPDPRYLAPSGSAPPGPPFRRYSDGHVSSALLVAWLAAGLVLRFAGIAMAAIGLLLALGGHPIGVLIAALGALVWAAGHWHYALRHHTYKSPLARRLFLDFLPTRLDPTQGWVISTEHDHD